MRLAALFLGLFCAAASAQTFPSRPVVLVVPFSPGSGIDILARAIGPMLEADKTMEIFRNWKNPDSPRAPIAIDPATRDIVQNEYLREVRKVAGALANVELETIAMAMKDPWKELQKKDRK